MCPRAVVAVRGIFFGVFMMSKKALNICAVILAVVLVIPLCCTALVKLSKSSRSKGSTSSTTVVSTPSDDSVVDDTVVVIDDSTPIYGVSWSNDANETKMTRTDDAVDLSYSINSSDGTIVSDFDDLSPWNGELVEIDGNMFKHFPAAYMRIETDDAGNLTGVAVSSTAHSEGNWFYYDDFYYGCYGASVSDNKLASVSGVVRSSNYTRLAYSNLAAANGDGYQQLDLKHRTITQFLWWIEYAVKDSDSIMTGLRNSESFDYDYFDKALSGVVTQMYNFTFSEQNPCYS
jgi:hypothetical protein